MAKMPPAKGKKPVHDDAAQDKKLIRAEIAKAAGKPPVAKMMPAKPFKRGGRAC